METNTINITYTQSDENNTSNLKKILIGFDGTMAMIGTVGGKKISATFNIVNGIISETIEYGNSEMSNGDLEKAFVGLEAGVLAGGAVEGIALAIGIAIGGTLN